MLYIGLDWEIQENPDVYLLVLEPGTLVTVTLNGFCDCDWLLDDIGPLAGITDTDGGICVFFDDGEESNGSGKVFCSLAADRPNTISSNLRLRFSLPPVAGGSPAELG